MSSPPPHERRPPPPQARGGQRLLGCLTKLKAVGVAVVVSRVYGGQHLGKARSIGQGCGEAAMSAVSDGSALAVAVFTRFSHLAAFTHAALIHPDRRASSTSVLPRASCSRRSATSPEPASITSGAADRRSAARPVRSRRRRPTARPRLPPAARGSERAWTQRRLRRRRRRPSVPCSRWRQSAGCPVAARRAHRQVGFSSRRSRWLLIRKSVSLRCRGVVPFRAWVTVARCSRPAACRSEERKRRRSARGPSKRRGRRRQRR